MLIIWFLLTARIYLENIVAGILVAGITTLFFGRYFIEGVGKFLEPKRYFWLLVYLIMFIWEGIKANFDVAYRVLHPPCPSGPDCKSQRYHPKRIRKSHSCQFHYHDTGNNFR